jgi:hypothetical protein
MYDSADEVISLSLSEQTPSLRAEGGAERW